MKRKLSPLLDKTKEFRIGLAVIAVGIILLFFSPKIFSFLYNTFYVPRFVTSVLFNKNIELKEEEEGVINVLLLGIAGGKHDGAYLTDTIIFAKVDPKKNRVTMVSIPRDLWVPVLGAKVNTAYEFGREKQEDGGLTLAKATMSEVIGEPINYAFRIDFSGFVKVVDLLGGLDIDVERSFDDYNYPVPGKEDDLCGKTEEEATQFFATISATPVPLALSETFPCRVEHLHFDRGQTHMDGETALKYVRSRQALGIEGTDFARGRRQQKIIAAARDKMLSLGVLLNPVKLAQLADAVSKSIDTDIDRSEFDDFVKLAEKMKGAAIRNLALDQGDESKNRPGLLIHPESYAEFNGHWVLSPKAGTDDFTQIHTYLKCEFERETIPSASPTATPLVKSITTSPTSTPQVDTCLSLLE